MSYEQKLHDACDHLTEEQIKKHLDSMGYTFHRPKLLIVGGKKGITQLRSNINLAVENTWLDAGQTLSKNKSGDYSNVITTC